MATIITKAELSRHFGVADAAVSQWISTGKLTAPALTDDGRVDLELAQQQLQDRLDPSRAKVDPTGGTGGLLTQLNRQKLEEAEIRLRRLRAEELQRHGTLMATEAAERAWGRALAHLIAELEVWVLQDLPSGLTLSADQRAALRRDWRACRQRLSDEAATNARSQFPLVTHPIPDEAA